MKVLLVNQPKIYYSEHSRISSQVDIGLPLGIMYIAAVLERGGHDVRLLDSLISNKARLINEGEYSYYGVPMEDLKKKIKKIKPHVVGVSNQFTSQFEGFIKVCKAIKEVDSSLPVVGGGPHITVRAAETLNEIEEVDICVIGEGEYTMLDLMASLEGKKELKDVEGIAFRKNNEIIKTKKRPFINNLDELPYPAYHLVEMEKYLTLSQKHIYTRDREEDRPTSMITSRGCPFNCIFCSIGLHMGNRFRAHSPKYVIDHIQFLVDAYAVRQIHFEDDNLTFNKKRCMEIFSGIIKNKIKISWDTPNGVRADTLDEELLTVMKKSGCKKLYIGIESGVQRVLDEVIGKRLKVEKVVEVAKLCKKLDIPLGGFYVIGFPGEKREEMEATANFARMLKRKYNVEYSGALQATPLYGTRLYEICEKFGYFARNVDYKSLATATSVGTDGLIKTEEFGPHDLKKINRKLTIAKYTDLILNPKYAFKVVIKNPKLILFKMKQLKGLFYD